MYKMYKVLLLLMCCSLCQACIFQSDDGDDDGWNVTNNKNNSNNTNNKNNTNNTNNKNNTNNTPTYEPVNLILSNQGEAPLFYVTPYGRPISVSLDGKNVQIDEPFCNCLDNACPEGDAAQEEPAFVPAGDDMVLTWDGGYWQETERAGCFEKVYAESGTTYTANFCHGSTFDLEYRVGLIPDSECDARAFVLGEDVEVVSLADRPLGENPRNIIIRNKTKVPMPLEGGCRPFNILQDGLYGRESQPLRLTPECGNVPVCGGDGDLMPELCMVQGAPCESIVIEPGGEYKTRWNNTVWMQYPLWQGAEATCQAHQPAPYGTAMLEVCVATPRPNGDRCIPQEFRVEDNADIEIVIGENP